MTVYGGATIACVHVGTRMAQRQEKTITAYGKTVTVHTYPGDAGKWLLEIVDQYGNSTCWDDQFDTADAAMHEAAAAIETEGIDAFIGVPNNASPNQEASPDFFAPLTEAETDELDNFLLYEVDNDESMTLDMMDGYLHAIAIGPVTLMPKQWMPRIWGEVDALLPPVIEDLDQANHILQLVMRHFNSIVTGFQEEPPEIYPQWSIFPFEDKEYDDAEGWAHGFTEGVKLCSADWQTLLSTPQGQQWYRPIGLLGEDDFSADQDALTRMPAQRAELALQIPDAVVAMHRYWLPLREAVYERNVATRLRTKVGRNEACPCGSGKKFKKCCGSAAELH